MTTIGHHHSGHSSVQSLPLGRTIINILSQHPLVTTNITIHLSTITMVNNTVHNIVLRLLKQVIKTVATEVTGQDPI